MGGVSTYGVVSIYEDGRRSGKEKLLNEVLTSFQTQGSKHVHMKAGWYYVIGKYKEVST